MIIERFGRYHRTLTPGAHLTIPFVDTPRTIDWRYVDLKVRRPRVWAQDRAQRSGGAAHMPHANPSNPPSPARRTRTWWSSRPTAWISARCAAATCERAGGAGASQRHSASRSTSSTLGSSTSSRRTPCRSRSTRSWCVARGRRGLRWRRCRAALTPLRAVLPDHGPSRRGVQGAERSRRRRAAHAGDLAKHRREDDAGRHVLLARRNQRGAVVQGASRRPGRVVRARGHEAVVGCGRGVVRESAGPCAGGGVDLACVSEWVHQCAGCMCPLAWARGDGVA